MARKATVDVDKVMQMLREGQSTQAVAEFFGVSRQAIDLHRHKFIQSGQLVDRRAPRRMVNLLEPAETGIRSSPTVSLPKSAETGVQGSEAVSLDRLIELIIEAFDSLKQVPKLEAELEKYKRDYQKAAEQIELLEKEVSKRQSQEARWKLVVPPEDGKPGS